MNFLFTNLPVIIDKPFTRYENLLSMNANNFNKNVLDKLNDLENKSWSCSDLENSIFFGPIFMNKMERYCLKKNSFDSQD